MWMMGYNDGADFNFPSPDHHYSFHGGRRLRPLAPRPLPNPPPRVNHIHAADFFPMNYHFPAPTMGGDQNKRDNFQAQGQPVVVSSRWNPTPEQLRALEELYRRGTRTPSADQIQHITAQLRRYGKIEGKNVFYWFQNHKARERQKRRRQMESEDHSNSEVFERKDHPSSSSSGANRTVYEVERTKNWTASTNCNSEAQEEAAPVQTAAVVAQSRTGAWMPLEEKELQHTRCNLPERNATWQTVMQLFSPSSSPSAAAKVTATAASSTQTTSLLMEHHVNIFMSSSPPYTYRESSRNCNNMRDEEEDINECRECETLQLFPLRGGSADGEEAGISSVAGMNSNDVANNAYQFFEFLPTKN